MAGAATLQIDITADNKSAINGVREVKNNIDGLKESIKVYQDLAWNEKDLGKLQTYNRELQSLQQQLKQTANAGKVGFDEMGVAIQKATGNPLGNAFSGLRQIAYILPGIGLAGIFNLAFEGIGKAASALGVFNTKLTDTQKQYQVLNEVNKEADKNAGKEIANLKLLYLAATDHNLAMKDRLKAANELKTEYPDILKNLSAEKIAAGGAASAYQALTDRVIENARAAAVASKVGELEAQRLQAEANKKKILAVTGAEIAGAKSYNTGGEANTTITKEEQILNATNRRNKSLKEQDDLLKQIDATENLLVSTITAKGVVDSLTNPDKPKKEKDTEKDALQELNKTLGQISEKYLQGAIDAKTFDAESIKAYDSALNKISATSKAFDILIQKQNEYLRPKKYGDLAKTIDSDPFTLDALKKQRENRLHPDADFKNPFGAPQNLHEGNSKGIFGDERGKKNINDTKELNEELTKSAHIADIAGDAFKNLFQDLAQGENIGEAITKVFTDLVKQIAAAAIKAFAFAVVLNVITGGAYSIGKIFTGAFGGNFTGKGYAKGGLATGPESGHMELLHGNEWVLRPEQLGGALNAAKSAGMIQGSLNEGAGSQVQVVGVIRGNDIHLSNQRTDFQRSLTTGIKP